MIINGHKIIDLRLREKTRSLLTVVIPLLIFISDTKNDSILIFLYFLCVDPFLSTYGVSCPFCSNNFFKIKYFAYPLYEEKERTKCFHCEQSPIIVSDRLPTDSLQLLTTEEICDFRITEKQNWNLLFTAATMIAVFLLITYLILKAALKIQDVSPYFIAGFGLIIMILYRKIVMVYNCNKCIKCSSPFLNPSFNIFKVFKEIKKCKCNSCGEEVFTRSYFVSTDFVPFVNSLPENQQAGLTP